MSDSESGRDIEFAPGLLPLARRLAGGTEADDLVQAAYVRTLERQVSVRARHAWLRRILINEHRMSLRGQKRREAREAAAAEERNSSIDVEEIVHWGEVARTLGTLLDQLDNEVAKVVRARYLDGDTAAEIARRHSIPAGTVRRRLKVGLERLREQLDLQYSGRRGLWAGALLPGSLHPPRHAPVSQPEFPPAASAAKAKGIGAATIKLLAASAVLTATVGLGAAGARLYRALDPRSQTAAAARGVEKPPEGASPAGLELDSPASIPKAWQRRAVAIHAGNGAAGPQQHEIPGSWRHGTTTEGAVLNIADEVFALVEGCDDLLAQAPPYLSLTLDVIRAPDIGTVVESVDLRSPSAVPDDLARCLTEAMYTLEQADADGNLEQQITIHLAGSAGTGEPFVLSRLNSDGREKMRAAVVANAKQEAPSDIRVLDLDGGPVIVGSLAAGRS